ncbi:MAG: ABC transporter ATP-binding protein [Bacteroidetes bacterium]|nr:MAG: ABC transporter ATP-binding protein [Bacteroidota bacterium]
MRVSLDKITKSFKKVDVLQEINLDIKDGEFVAFLGPSGCGKTTTLLIVAGIYKATSGIIKFDDTVVNKLVPKDRNIGMVFQSYALYSHMNVYQNLTFSLMLRKKSKVEMDKAAKITSEMMGIGHLLDRKVGMLSGGQQQRVALGRALIKKPGLLLFDEPLSNLDARLRIHMRSEIKKIQHDLGTTAIYVTHDQIEAMSMADRIAVMKEGVMQAYDTPSNIHDKPKTMFVATFVGNPPMNIFDVTLQKENEKLYVKISEGLTLEVPPERTPKSFPERVKMGIRPQDLEIGGKEGLTFKVFMIEPTGRDDVIVCENNGLNFTGLATPGHSIKENENIKVSFDMEKVQFFDADTEKSILWN